MENSTWWVVSLLTVILLITGYVRGVELGMGITSTYLVPVFTGIGTSILLWSTIRSGSVEFDIHHLLWLGVIVWTFASLIYNVAFRPDLTTSIRLVAELSVCFGLLFLYASLPDKQALKRVYQSFIAVSALASAGLFTYPMATGDTTIRRVGGYDIPGAVNNISQMIGVAIVIAIVGILLADHWRQSRLEIASMPPLIAGLIITGSRAAILGVLVALVILILIDERTGVRAVVALGAVSLVGVSLVSLYDYTGIYRFQFGFLIESGLQRVDIYMTAIEQSGTGVLELLFGGGMYRYSELAPPAVSHIIYPHNYIISLLVHIGLPASGLFIIGIVRDIRELFSLWFNDDSKSDYLPIATTLGLVVVLFYAMTSGRLTRLYTVWIFLGASELILSDTSRETTQSISSTK
jgi:hypothetical protein